MKFIGLTELIQMLFNPQKEFTMSKEQIVSDAKASFVSGQDQILSEVLGSVYEQSKSENAGSGSSGPSEADIQARIDAAVAAKGLEDDAKLAEALAADKVIDQAKIDELNGMISGLQAQMSALQVEHDALIAKEGVESAQLESIKASKAQLQAVVDYLASLLSPPPAPVPEPAPEVPPVQA